LFHKKKISTGPVTAEWGALWNALYLEDYHLASVPFFIIHIDSLELMLFFSLQENHCQN
jgi:hypothetical protein